MANSTILALNAGSSSVKFALFEITDRPNRILHGKLDRIGFPDTELTAPEIGVKEKITGDASTARQRLMDWLKSKIDPANLKGIGHRIVHGGSRFTQSQKMDSEMISELKPLCRYAPEHLPAELALIESCSQGFPHLPQVACFDTAFHRDLPLVAKTLGIPRHYTEKGIRRYGFHGLSCSYLMGELARQTGSGHALGKVIIAHLGNGCSLTAVREGKSIDTSMAFTPVGGIPMGTRCGDIDAGLIAYMSLAEGMSVEQFYRMINKESGLLGVSGISSDMRDLLSQMKDHPQAAEAVEWFCYQISKWIGAYSVALEGLETIIFSGGMGENASPVRAKICDRLHFLGVRFDPDGNSRNASIISRPESSITVRVIPTDEEAIIAEDTHRLVA
jgi:acetate kinase